MTYSKTGESAFGAVTAEIDILIASRCIMMMDLGFLPLICRPYFWYPLIWNFYFLTTNPRSIPVSLYDISLRISPYSCLSFILKIIINSTNQCTCSLSFDPAMATWSMEYIYSKIRCEVLNIFTCQIMSSILLSFLLHDSMIKDI